jgi:hypothetical protein
MQALFSSAFDTKVALAAGATHVEIHRGSAPFQRLWWSWTGAVDSWKVIQAPSRLPLGPVRSALPIAPDPLPTGLYLRKPYNPRHLSSWDGIYPGKAGVFSGDWDASTNTPTLVNGTGSDRQYFYVTAAGAVDFGAGAIAFVVGDWVIFDAALGAAGRWIKATDDPRKSLADDQMVEITVSFTQD